MLEDMKSILISEEEIAKRVKELGKQLAEDYKGKELLVVGILKGCMLFLSDLVRTIDLPLTLDFMVVSSYGATTKSSGVVRIVKDLEREIEGKDVLIVEDIVDTGLTLSYLVENFKARNPKSVKVCSLLDKPDRRKAQVEIQYIGFKIPDEFVVGYGLDYGENYRNLPFVCVLKPEVYEKK
ncbi:MAG TPA: hypoxanthine phosphoribosyltransferase [Bacillota bacterium]|nr:hypoxanthine phosphoribosyltransferase [Clostridiaceae bacterium]HNR04908.1 hypoxanthine phosphoribosyltransferase [Bacillota bacterium]HNT03625.1 hypoxanthine phosphoribosyltransferase [Bacillota bacterium]HPA53739.1 hypoxanthine phosphoribosyltransferase [Bacillota bacterium]HPX69791.1 hypoxanthine phosphoribosyltransferase [Bacillota bacterium]